MSSIIILSISALAIFPYIAYKTREFLGNPIKSSLKLSDIYLLLFLAAFIIVGYFQVYIWTQSHYRGIPFTIPMIFIDELIPRDGGIVWPYVYIIFYHIYLLLAIICVKDYKHFCNMMLGSAGLMLLLGCCFYFFPTNINLERTHKGSLLLQKIFEADKTTNNFLPSGHMAFSTYNYFFLRPVLGKIFSAIIPIIVAFSCLRTGQHIFLDLFAGWMVGLIWYKVFLNKFKPNYFPI